mgnify:CR=1 FL=1
MNEKLFRIERLRSVAEPTLEAIAVYRPGNFLQGNSANSEEPPRKSLTRKSLTRKSLTGLHNAREATLTATSLTVNSFENYSTPEPDVR